MKKFLAGLLTLSLFLVACGDSETSTEETTTVEPSADSISSASTETDT